MAPKRGESMERTAEHESFMKKLAAYHEARGTTLDPEPKVGVRHVDLFKLYNRVVEEGGYDLCSDTKAKPLMWRRFAEEFVGKNQYTAAQAFQIKNVYYKNLVAYEITHHWEKEPPPKEILEEVTAKGGNVMARTLENFTRPPTKEELNLGGSEAGDASPEQNKTPKVEKSDDGTADDPGSANAGRTTRGLRHAPPQRQLFHPDSAAQGRQTRGAVNGAPSPTPGTNGVMTMSATASSTLASYEPSQSYPLSLKPVTTPSNNPDAFRAMSLKRKAESSMGPLAKKYKNIMLPGTGFIGPNIYVRAQLALQSGIEDEEMYALHHLVKISHERGDKYRFDGFAGLAEALLRKCLSVCGLFYDVEWDISYDYNLLGSDEEMLDGLRGTPDIVRRMQNAIPKDTDDNLQIPAFLSQLNRIMEAGLVLRNMCLQAENAKYLIAIPTTRDYLACVLNLPSHPGIVELRHYALETAEQVLVWCDLGPRDSLYEALLKQLEGEDRGAIVLALRTLARVAMHLPGPKRLDGVSADVLRKVQNWLLVEDEELRAACLDFLFQYSSSADNVANLLGALDGSVLAKQLTRLLLFAATESRKPNSSTPIPVDPEEEGPHPVPRLSKDVIDDLLSLPEPERSSEWLRMCFTSASSSEITQIALWQAYQATFSPYNTASRNHLVAGEFIKNVSTTFAGATAQVAGGGKYVIRGIRARKAPVEAGLLAGGRKGDELGKCGWHVPAQTRSDGQVISRGGECSEWFRREGDSLLEHVLRDHLQLPRKAAVDAVKAEDSGAMDVDSGLPSSAMAGRTSTPGTRLPPTQTLGVRYDFMAADTAVYQCRWGGSCVRSSADFTGIGEKTVSRTALFARHITTHLPSPPNAAGSKSNVKISMAGKMTGERTVFQGLVDEKGDAAGVPLSAALVLRNIAKFMPARQGRAVRLPTVAGGTVDMESGVVSLGLDEEVDASTEKDADGNLMARVFDEEVVEGLMWAMSTCKPIHAYVGSVLRAIGRGGGGG